MSLFGYIVETCVVMRNPIVTVPLEVLKVISLNANEPYPAGEVY